jgi:hypothetical protein
MADAGAWVIIPKLDKEKTGCVLDMRPLVLCKDCKHWWYGNYCDKHGKGQENADWFCADGEEK